MCKLTRSFWVLGEDTRLSGQNKGLFITFSNTNSWNISFWAPRFAPEAQGHRKRVGWHLHVWWVTLCERNLELGELESFIIGSKHAAFCSKKRHCLYYTVVVPARLPRMPYMLPWFSSISTTMYTNARNGANPLPPPPTNENSKALMNLFRSFQSENLQRSYSRFYIHWSFVLCQKKFFLVTNGRHDILFSTLRLY